MTLPVQPVVELVCRGTPFQMGVMQGEQLRERIRSAFETVAGLEAFRLMKPPLLPLGVFRRLAEIKAQRFLSAALSRTDVAAGERLRGMAAGAGVPLRRLALCAALEAVLSDLTRTTAHGLVAGCSAIAVTGDSSVDGSPRIAHNFDYLPATQPYYVIRHSHPTEGFRSIDFTLAPLPGTVDGINEAGLAISCNYAYATDHGPPAPTITMLIAEVLLRCRTVAEALDRFRRTPRVGGGLLMIADADGTIGSIEISSTTLEFRTPEPGASRLAHTNRYCCRAMQAVELDRTATFNRRAPQIMRGRRVHQSAECRDSALDEFVRDRAPLDSGDLQRIMSHHGAGEVPGNDSVCMHGDYWHTTASLQLLPTERRLRASFSPACVAEFRDFELGPEERLSAASAGNLDLPSG